MVETLDELDAESKREDQLKINGVLPDIFLKFERGLSSMMGLCHYYLITLELYIIWNI